MLLRGQYDGVLQVDLHHIALEPDFSNVGEVPGTLRRDDPRAITQAASDDVVMGGGWTYRDFVQTVEAVAPGGFARQPAGSSTRSLPGCRCCL